MNFFERKWFHKTALALVIVGSIYTYRLSFPGWKQFVFLKNVMIFSYLCVGVFLLVLIIKNKKTGRK